jgi:hypothetical protein
MVYDFTPNRLSKEEQVAAKDEERAMHERFLESDLDLAEAHYPMHLYVSISSSHMIISYHIISCSMFLVVSQVRRLAGQARQVVGARLEAFGNAAEKRVWRRSVEGR